MGISWLTGRFWVRHQRICHVLLMARVRAKREEQGRRGRSGGIGLVELKSPHLSCEDIFSAGREPNKAGNDAACELSTSEVQGRKRLRIV